MTFDVAVVGVIGLVVHHRYYEVVNLVGPGDSFHEMIRSGPWSGYGLSTTCADRRLGSDGGACDAEIVSKAKTRGGDGDYRSEVEYAAKD